MRAVIFANGTLTHFEDSPPLTRAGDLIIAADGGLRHCQRLGLLPHTLIGDFDSLDAHELPVLERAGVRVVRHPPRKDATDLEIAVHYAHTHGAEEVLIYGGVGSRWDQSLANLLLCASQEFTDLPIRMVDGPQSAQLIHSDETLIINGQPGDTVSLIPLQDHARGVTTQGLEYALHNGVLEFGSTRGISNTLLGERGSVHLEEGLLLCILIHGPVEVIETDRARGDR